VVISRYIRDKNRGMGFIDDTGRVFRPSELGPDPVDLQIGPC